MEILRCLGKALSLSESTQFVPSCPRTGLKQNTHQPSVVCGDRPQLSQRTPRRAVAGQDRTGRTLTCPSLVPDARVLLFYRMIRSNSTASGSAGLRTDLQSGSSFLGHPEQSVTAPSTEIAQTIRSSRRPHKKMIRLDRPIVLEA